MARFTGPISRPYWPVTARILTRTTFYTDPEPESGASDGESDEDPEEQVKDATL